MDAPEPKATDPHAPRSSRRGLVRLADLSDGRLDDVLDLAERYKAGARRDELAGRSVGFLFFRGSLRTRTSFEIAVHQLGGRGVHLSAGSDFWEVEAREGVVMDGTAPEHVKDAARVLSTYCDALAIRPRPAGRAWEVDRRDEAIQAWSQHATVPVLNMESALWHPLQALADLMTLRETFGRDLSKKRLAITWTPSPTPSSPSVVHSLLLAALRSGMDVTLAHPRGFELDGGVMSEARSVCAASGADFREAASPRDAARGAHVVYARPWASLENYGQKSREAHRVTQSRDWLVDDELLALGEDTRFMHPMPVRRNLEVTDAVLDGPRSLVLEQAANRLHTQKGLLSLLLRS
ncbi:MAG: N-acetylornithine carbamoyltransferase [Planctomycetota bacterium]